MGGIRKSRRREAAGDREIATAFVATISGAGVPRVARLHHRSFPCHDGTGAARVVQSAMSALPTSVRLLVAGGAFGSAALPTPTAVRRPNAPEFDACLEAAGSWLAAFELAVGPALTVEMIFGLDVYATTKRGGGALPVAQLVAHVQVGGPGRIVAAKRFPTPGDEERYVYLDGRGHGLPVAAATALGRTLGLGCHDGAVYSPRGEATERAGGWRSRRRAEVQGDLRAATAAVNCIHALPSDRTFACSYRRAVAATPGLQLLGAFGSKVGVTRANALAMAARLTVPPLPTVELIPAGW